MLQRVVAVMLFLVSLAAVPAAWSADSGSSLVSETGNLLKGTLYKQSGMEREGIITIRTSWRLPGAPPVFRYDFDMLHGTVDNNLFNFLMADIAEIEFLPTEDGAQPVNIKLRNGAVQKVVLTSEDKSLIGTAKLKIKEVLVVTDQYGENIVTGTDVTRIVFSPPAPVGEENMPGLTDELGKALEVGKRDGLVDENFLAVLEKLQKKMKAKLTDESPQK